MSGRSGTRRAGAAVLSLSLLVGACGGGDGDATSDPAAVETAVTETATVDSTVGPEPSAAPEATVAVDTAAPDTAAPEPATGPPIRIGTITTESGGLTVTGNRDALESYFADYNAAGGWHGRPVEVVSADGGTNDPAATTTAIQELLEQDIVAMVSGASLVECVAGTPLYDAKDVPSIVVPFLPLCGGPTYFPISLGLDTSMMPAVGWLMDTQDTKKLAALLYDLPFFRDGLVPNVTARVEAAGGEVVVEYIPLGANPDIQGAVSRLLAANPDAVISSVDEATTAAAIQAAQGQGLDLAETEWVVAPGLYSQAFVDLVSETAEGLYLLDSYYLFDSDHPGTQALLDSLERHVETPSPDVFEQFGWMGATVFAAALDSIPSGTEITSSAIKAALGELVLEESIYPGTIDFTIDPRLVAPIGFIARLEAGRFVTITPEPVS
jgi:branched-chain amino acid transport system substrate-binding protein